MAYGQRTAGVGVGPAVAPRLVGGGPEAVAAPTPTPLYVETDHLATPISGKEDGAAAIEAMLNPPAAGFAYLVERIYVRTTSTDPTSCTIYVGEVADANERDYTDDGDQNTADYGPELLVPGGQALRVRWEGASAGAVGMATVQYRVVFAPNSAPMGGRFR